MTPDLLLAHFGRLADAPDAIPRLRRFILDLAVRGKLVEQDTADEPASNLLLTLEAEKSRAEHTVRGRGQRSTEPTSAEDQPFALPASWEWCRLRDVGLIVGGGTPPSGDPENFTTPGSGIAWLTPADMAKYNGHYVSRGARDITERGLRSSSATIMPKGSVLFTSRAPIGYTAIARNEVCTNQGFKSVVPYLMECSRYIALYFQAFTPWIDSKASGTTFREVSGKTVSALPFPLAPLNEQQRIVARVDELMAVCDQLEAVQAEREGRRDQLVTASLHRLSEPSDDGTTAQEDARFILTHLPRLVTRPEHVKQIRETILALAVRGKLVPQDPNDEPASVALDRMATRTRSAQSGRDWVGKAPVRPREAFSPPSGWTWTRIANAVDRVTVGFVSSMKDRYVPTGIPFLRSQNVRPNQYRPDGLVYITREFHRALAKSALAPGDVVVVRSGNVGTACTIPPSLLEANCADLVVVKNPMAVLPDFLCFYLNSLAASHVDEGAVGIALTHFNTKSVALMPLPLPPLAEQRRIVAKVGELMALCDQLEAQLTQTRADSRRLLEAILREALTPGASEAEREVAYA